MSNFLLCKLTNGHKEGGAILTSESIMQVAFKMSAENEYFGTSISKIANKVGEQRLDFMLTLRVKRNYLLQ